MKNMRSCVNGLWALLIIWVSGCDVTSPSSATKLLPEPKYKVDGSFEDWTNYTTGCLDVGLDWTKDVKILDGDPGNFRDIKGLYYDNDETYLYIFLKFKPSVQEQYEKKQSPGGVASFFIDSDCDTNTGAGERDHSSGSAIVAGSDLEIDLPTGIYASARVGQAFRSGCYIHYEIKRWEPSSKSMVALPAINRSREADSRSDHSLIAHGSDGVELALLLSDLQKAKGNTFCLICREDASPIEYATRISVKIK